MSEQHLCLQSGTTLPFLLGAAVHLRGLAHPRLQGLKLHQQTVQLLFLLSQLVLLLGQLGLQPVLFQLMHRSEQLHLLVLEGLEFHPYFFSHLHVLSLRDVLVVQDVHVPHSLGLEVAVQLGAPVGEEGVPGPQQLVGLPLRLQVAPEDLLLELMRGLIIRKVVLDLIEVSLELEDVLLVVADFGIEGVLLVGVGGLQLPDLVAVDLSEPADLLEQVRDLPVFEGDLRAEDL